MNLQHIRNQFHNDFAGWAFHALHDNFLAERLAIINPTNLNSEHLRNKLIEIIEQRLEEHPKAASAKSFHFIRSTMIIFDCNLSISEPKDLPKLVSQLSAGSIFYHFIDSRLRTGEDDFSAWLKGFGDQYVDLIERIQGIDPYFITLSELKEELLIVLNLYFKDGAHG